MLAFLSLATIISASDDMIILIFKNP